MPSTRRRRCRCERGSRVRNKVVWLDKGWQPVSIGFCPSVKVWERVLCEYGVEASPPDMKTNVGCVCDFSNPDTGETFILVAVRDSGAGPEELMGTFIHEAAHVWQRIKRAVGEDAPGDEMEAYALEHIALEIRRAHEWCHAGG